MATYQDFEAKLTFIGFTQQEEYDLLDLFVDIFTTGVLSQVFDEVAASSSGLTIQKATGGNGWAFNKSTSTLFVGAQSYYFNDVGVLIAAPPVLSLAHELSHWLVVIRRWQSQRLRSRRRISLCSIRPTCSVFLNPPYLLGAVVAA
ncbi:MAG: hypothetical protein KJ587_18615 [Alphaproteobacteria bacterium]|nr:hypothetical protein [Alphaproteobacteria bacterium]